MGEALTIGVEIHPAYRPVMWSPIARGCGPPRMRMPHSRLDSIARLVSFALPTSATSSSTTMIFACSAAPGGRDNEGQCKRSASRPGKGVAADEYDGLSAWRSASSVTAKPRATAVDNALHSATSGPHSSAVVSFMWAHDDGAAAAVHSADLPHEGNELGFEAIKGGPERMRADGGADSDLAIDCPAESRCERARYVHANWEKLSRCYAQYR
jgi:hypothetical protein